MPFHPVQDITALFASDKCPNYTTCEFADNDCWYVTFGSEEDTRKVRLCSLERELTLVCIAIPLTD